MANKQIALRIKNLCKEYNVFMKDVLIECNINRNFIYDLEHREQILPSLEYFIQLADYFDCSLDYIACRSNKIK